MGKINKWPTANDGVDVGKGKYLLPVGETANGAATLETRGKNSLIVENKPTSGPVVPQLGICPNGLTSYSTDIGSGMLIAPLFTIAREHNLNVLHLMNG